jgi:MFS family permease
LTIGAAAGSLLAGPLVDKMGRKFLTLFTMLVYIAGWLTMIFDKNSMITAIIGRCITGFGVGFCSVSVPTYIGEVSTPDIRGVLGACMQLSG